jgi:hypothetical protein
MQMPAWTTSPNRRVWGREPYYRHFPTRDTLIEAVYHTEVEKLAAAQRELSANLPPIEASPAWMMLCVDYIATKQIIASAMNSVVGGPSRLYDSSRVQVTGAIDALVKTAMKSATYAKISSHATCFARRLASPT